MTRDTFKPKGIPFDPPTGDEAAEYRVLVNADGLLFTTGWYIESHGRNVFKQLCDAYSRAGFAYRCILQKRQIVGDIVTDTIRERQ
jgi:hypothetical protein